MNGLHRWGSGRFSDCMLGHSGCVMGMLDDYILCFFFLKRSI